MTVWVFGDSFATLIDKSENQKQYMEIIADHYNTDLKTFGICGTNLEYTYNEFHRERDNIQNGDILIITTTVIARRWFFECNPDLAADDLGREYSETQSIKRYRAFLDTNYVPHRINFFNFLYTVNELSEKLNLKTMVLCVCIDTEEILENFKNKIPKVHIAKGLLNDDLYLKEMTDEFKNYYESLAYDKRGDPRPNHMIKSNHIILADKIINHINQGTDIDLTQVFVEKYIGFKDEQDYTDEFFGFAWDTFVDRSSK